MTRTLLWEEADPSAVMVHQEDWRNPHPDVWEDQVAGAVLRHSGSLIVAHSLGCLVVARLVESWPELRISGALLVAPPDPSRSERLAGFADISRKALPFPAIVIASRNDPWMPIQGARRLAGDWGAQFVDHGMSGHINAESGFGPWPNGLALRDSLLRTIDASAFGTRARPSTVREARP